MLQAVWREAYEDHLGAAQNGPAAPVTSRRVAVSLWWGTATRVEPRSTDTSLAIRIKIAGGFFVYGYGPAAGLPGAGAEIRRGMLRQKKMKGEEDKWKMKWNKWEWDF